MMNINDVEPVLKYLTDENQNSNRAKSLADGGQFFNDFINEI